MSDERRSIKLNGLRKRVMRVVDASTEENAAPMQLGVLSRLFNRSANALGFDGILDFLEQEVPEVATYFHPKRQAFLVLPVKLIDGSGPLAHALAFEDQSKFEYLLAPMSPEEVAEALACDLDKAKELKDEHGGIDDALKRIIKAQIAKIAQE